MLDLELNRYELELVTVDEMAVYLGVCPNTVRALIRKNIIKCLSVGKNIRIFKYDSALRLYDLARRDAQITLE